MTTTLSHNGPTSSVLNLPCRCVASKSCRGWNHRLICETSCQLITVSTVSTKIPENHQISVISPKNHHLPNWKHFLPPSIVPTKFQSFPPQKKHHLPNDKLKAFVKKPFEFGIPHRDLFFQLKIFELQIRDLAVLMDPFGMEEDLGPKNGVSNFCPQVCFWWLRGLQFQTLGGFRYRVIYSYINFSKLKNPPNANQ